MLLHHMEESDKQTERILGDKYVHFMDALPEIREFVEALEAKKKVKVVDGQDVFDEDKDF